MLRARIVLIALCAGLALRTVPARAQEPTPTPTPAATSAATAVKEDVVVSAARGPEMETEIPGQATVISGERLRRENVRALADALQDVVGIDTGLGSDNGARLPNIGMWGLKEFDGCSSLVDGVPVGGPFNPSLAQIDIEDVDRIEIVKGPQGTLYGVSAFAGMIQEFTRAAGPSTRSTRPTWRRTTSGTRACLLPFRAIGSRSWDATSATTGTTSPRVRSATPSSTSRRRADSSRI